MQKKPIPGILKDVEVAGHGSFGTIYHILGIFGIFTVSCWYAKPVVITLVISFMLVFILDPAVRILEKYHVRRWMSSLLVIILSLILFFSIFYALFVKVQSFTQDLPKYRIKMEKIWVVVQNRMKRIEKATQDIIPQSQPEKAVPEVKIQETSKWQSITGYFLGILTYAALVPFLVFFVLNARDDLKQKVTMLFGEENQESALQAVNQMRTQMIGFLSGNFVSILILWVITSLGFVLVGMDYAVLNAGFFAVCNIIPVIGPVIGLIPPLFFSIMQAESWPVTIWILCFGLGMHLIYANILLPKLVGNRVQLSPVAIIIAMIYWGWLWGATGLLLAIPMVACFKTICTHVEPWKPIGKLLE